jgi:hypothetical protein
MSRATLTPARLPWTLKRKLSAAIAATLLPLLLVGAVLYTKAEFIVLGAEAYIFGYPLVITDLTRANAALTLGPENQLNRVRQFPGAGFKEVVRPNVDTLYTTAFIDMDQGPWVFAMAANDQRYALMPFMDAWTHVFAAPGTRATGPAGGEFLLAGPTWHGEVPPGLTLLRSPTRTVWLIGRTQTNGVADYPLVHRLQDGVTLRSLRDWRAGRGGPDDQAKPDRTALAGSDSATLAGPTWQASTPRPLPPLLQMQAMGTPELLRRLARLMADNPPARADGPMMAKLSRIGIVPGRNPDWSLADRWALSLGRWIADFTVARELKKPRDLVRGWSMPPDLLGNYGTAYNVRAVVAMVGLGANLPADAVYPNTRVDATGQPLNGQHRYRLHFKADSLPPINAFWSITAYGADDYLMDNPIQRHALGDRDPLVFNPDGSLDLLVQADPPQDDGKGGARANWLPVKAGEPFLLNARLYWPKPAVLNGSWGMPAVERID